MSRETRLIDVVVGILKRGNTILVGQRPSDKPYSGYWEFPGGKVEKNESNKAALKRELHEELGITVIDAHSLFIQPHAYPDKTVLLDIWLVSEFRGEPLGKENQALRWVTLSEMHSLRLLEGNWPILTKLTGILS